MIFPFDFFLMVDRICVDFGNIARDPSTTARISFEWGPDRHLFGVIWTEHEMQWPVVGLERDQYERSLFDEADRALAIQQERYT